MKYLAFIIICVLLFVFYKCNNLTNTKRQIESKIGQRDAQQIELDKILISQQFIRRLNHEISQHKEIQCSGVTLMKKTGVAFFKSFNVSNIKSRDQIEKLIQVIQSIMVDKRFELDEVHFLFILEGEKIINGELGLYSYLIRPNNFQEESIDWLKN